MPVAAGENPIFTDAVDAHPQVIQSSVRGVVTPTAISTTAKPLTPDKVKTAIQKSAPIMNLHPQEKFFNTSVDDFLSHCELVEVVGKKAKKMKNLGVHITADLPQKGKDGQFYLDLKPEGQKGDFSKAKAYVDLLGGGAVQDLGGRCPFRFQPCYGGILLLRGEP